MNHQRPRMTSKRRAQRGTAMVEAALVLLPFMAMMLGIVNLGLNFFLVDALQDRAALAARYASLHPEDAAGTRNMLLYGSTSAVKSDEVVSPNTGYMGMDESNVSVVRLDVGLPSERLVVTISGYDLPMFIPGVAPHVVGAPIVATVSAEVP